MMGTTKTPHEIRSELINASEMLGEYKCKTYTITLQKAYLIELPKMNKSSNRTRKYHHHTPFRKVQMRVKVFNTIYLFLLSNYII